MKIKLQLAAASAALLMISNLLPAYAAGAGGLPESSVSQNDAFVSGIALPEVEKTVTSGDLVLDEAPAFSAHVEYFHGQGYVVKGTFTEFLPNTDLVRPLYSPDGENWQTCQTAWNLQWLGSEDADDLKQLQNQICLHSTHEPLAGYLTGQLDRFYLKLQITLKNGLTYETQAAVIDRGDPQPIPEELSPVAGFVPAMLIRQWRPFQRYGQYQITVSADAAPEDISALLPDTLPIEIQLYAGIDFVTNAVVDCPVTWKPLSLSRLTTGESVTVADAAEEIIVPAGTLLNTPNGLFQLNEPLDVEHDELRLILNVAEENAEPTGVLACEINGLQMAFHLKPTGATAIRAYTLSEGGTDWVELPKPLLPEEVNAPSSTANSTYTLVLKNTSEPYQSYLAAWNAGDEPTPFLVGLKIEGGVYDGQQLILSWPDTYDLPARLPDLDGSGGNECNAGSGNKNDSTPEGQRPGLPQNPEDGPDAQLPEPTQQPADKQDGGAPLPEQPLTSEDAQPPKTPLTSEDAQPPETPLTSEDAQQQETPLTSEDSQLPETPLTSEDSQPPETPLTSEDAKQQEQPRPLEEKTDVLAAEKDDSFTQPSAGETLPALIARAVNPASDPAVSEETGTPVWEKDDRRTERGLHRFLLAAAAAITAGVCIAAAVGKIAAGSTSGGIFGKIIRMLNKLLRAKQ